MITVATWPLSQFETYKKHGNLNLSPEYQRRPVWQLKDRMFLVDSIVQQVPIGAVTLFVDRSRHYDYYEVIDGKQRLTSILDYLDDNIVLRSSVVSQITDTEEDERDTSNNTAGTIARAYYDCKYSELEHPERMRLLQYQVPVFLVEGSRAEAVYAFTRMNRTNYTLKPQEIRNAIFLHSAFLKAAITVVQDLDTSVGGQPFFLQVGAISKQARDRMQDIQLASELLLLLLSGPQHRRDSLDSDGYERYQSPGAAEQAALTSAVRELTRICIQLNDIFGSTAMQAAHFPGACENDYYGLVGALHTRGLLTAAQLTSIGQELFSVIQEFRRNVEDFIGAVRQGRQIEPDEFDRLVEQYGRGFLGGQVNSLSRRKERIAIWQEVIDGIAATLHPQATFSSQQRRLIWARSIDKQCARCGEVVEWKDYHAGHIVPHALGGSTQVENGQVEHSWCNLSAGAS